MDLGLAGRVALVTAASRGLGLASAKALAAEGTSLVICARGVRQLEQAAGELRTMGARVEALQMDVSQPEAAEQLVNLVKQKYGQLDVLVNNAGGPPPGGFAKVGDSDWERAFQQTLMCAVRLVRQALPMLTASGRGRVINLVSTSVKQPIDDLILSNSLRLAVIGFAKTLSREVAGSGITVNCVLPGIILTDRQRELRGADAARRGISFETAIEEVGRSIPAGRIGQPEEVGALVAFLAGAQAAYITGTSIQVDGGLVIGLF
jgi:3-oxoacyl-[acyl-carrier protein] reductase